ncbi:hypothetical protein DFP73DRAFT_566893 [Morchella snyderi]|nr:hypothetical protein DFP73DRAFT_566893 [Morchella snyderi]
MFPYSVSRKLLISLCWGCVSTCPKRKRNSRYICIYLRELSGCYYSHFVTALLDTPLALTGILEPNTNKRRTNLPIPFAIHWPEQIPQYLVDLLS